ncbi:MAG: tetratricopeptide repeat protein [Bacteroidaceae bacterium]|nr:tetratricopeptide repeat protein [Bacteroidaceae bacterium]
MKKRVLYIILFCCIGILSGKSHDQKSQAQSFIDKSIEIQYSNPRQSAFYAQQAINSIKGKEHNDIKIKAMLALSIAQNFLGDFDQGIKTLHEALQYVTPSNKNLEGEIYSMMCILYCRLSDYQQSIELNDKATAIFKSIGDSAQIASCYNSRGVIHTYLNEFNIAETFFRQALSINRSLKELKKVAANLNNLCLYEGNTEEKLSFIKEAIAINKNLNSTWSLAENYNNMGKQYFYAKNYSQSLEALQKANEIATQLGAKDLICDNYEYSSWVYAALGNYQKAYKYLQLLTALSKELHSSSQLRNIESEIAQKKIEDQRREAELKEQAYEIELLKRKQHLLFITFISLIIVCVFVYKWYKRKKNLELMKAQYNLEQSEREIAELKVRQQELELQSVQNKLNNSQQEATNFAVFLQSRNELLDKIRELIKEGYKLNDNEISTHLKKVNAFIKQHQNGDKTSGALLLSIEEKNQEFLERLTTLHPNLTQGEKHLATLLRVNLSTKDIAMLTGTMPKTINMNRYRLRKSLGLSSEEDLARYLQRV